MYAVAVLGAGSLLHFLTNSFLQTEHCGKLFVGFKTQTVSNKLCSAVLDFPLICTYGTY